MAEHGLPDTGFGNMELKARLDSLEPARQTACQLATAPCQILLQVDTYFACRRGRLKLREIEESGAREGGAPRREAQLIWYDRSDVEAAKPCHFHLTRVADVSEAKAALTAAWGVRCVVRKRREVYWYHNVRIHLDDVEDLGQFLEFEAVLRSPERKASGATGPRVVDEAKRLLVELQQQFAIGPEQLIAGSYQEMAFARRSTS